MEQPQHWPTERMIAEGHADYATPEDLEGLDQAFLIDIAKLCEVDIAQPDECIPCRAYAIFMDREKEEAEIESGEQIPYNPEDPEDQARLQAEIDALQKERDVFAAPTSFRDVEVVPAPKPFQEEEEPVVERFAWKVKELNDLVSELLEGPPIPPPNVSLDELALLVLGAKKWVQITEAQGMELSGSNQAILQATKSLVARLHHG